MRRCEAVLLDLDGTILQIDMRGFFDSYLKLIAQVFPEIPSERLIQQLLASTSAMIASNDPSKTNREVFNEDFYPKLGLEPDECAGVLETFYREEFPKLEGFGAPKPEARRVLEYALEKGIGLVVATNPIFPKIAIVERLRWAMLDDIPFDLITTYEIMHFCKPHPGYYREILEMTGFSASHTIMVGNDVTEDMIAQEVGMGAFLVTDQVIPSEDGLPWEGKQGTLGDFLAYLRDGRERA